MYSGRGIKWLKEPWPGSRIIPDHPLVEDLVGCWLVNEGCGKVHDISGYGSHGTLTNGNATWSAGDRGRAIFYNGSNDIVTCDTKSVLDNIGRNTDNPVTIFSRVKRLGAGGGDPVRMFGKSTGTWYGFLGHNNTNYRIGWYYEGASDLSVEGNLTVPADKWATMAVAGPGGYSSSDFKLYVDGVECSSYPTQNSGYNLLDNSSVDWCIGNRETLGRDFNGYIDFHFVWRRELTEREIESLQDDNYQFIEPPYTTYWSIPVVAAGGAKALAGSFAAVAAVSGISPILARNIIGSFASSASASGQPLLRAKSLSGSLGAQSSLSALISRLKLLVGSLAATSGLSATISRLKRLVGSFEVVSSLVGALTKTVKGIKTLAGTIVSSSAVSGTIQRARSLSGSFATVSSLTGRLAGGVKALAGAIATSSSVSATISVVARFRNATIQGINQATGEFVNIVGKIRWKKEDN